MNRISGNSQIRINISWNDNLVPVIPDLIKLNLYQTNGNCNDKSKRRKRPIPHSGD